MLDGSIPPLDRTESVNGLTEAVSVRQPEAARMSGTAPSSSAHSGAPGAHAGAEEGRYGSLVKIASQFFDVDADLIKAVIKQESQFNPNALSPKGAMGLMQLMPDTANMLGVDDAYNPAKNIYGGTKFLRSMIDRFGGDLKLALAAYNAGPNAVDAAGGVPDYPETRNYVDRVIRHYMEYKGER
jgi:soluble lytic murein transglycosylase-like protein